jgi:hypothetical protein
MWSCVSEVRDGEEVVVLHLDPPRPTAEVVNGAAEFNPGFSITENKQHACVFRLVFQYVPAARWCVLTVDGFRPGASSSSSSSASKPQWSIRLLEDHSLLR